MANELTLDEILAEPAAPLAEVTAEPVAETLTTEAQPRSLDGKFAPKADETADTTAQAIVEGTDPAGKPPTGFAPIAALHEERSKRQALETSMAELRGQIEVLSRQRHAPVAAPADPVKPPEFWEAPDKFVENALTPIQQQMQKQFERTSRMMAVQQHGAETVQSAYKAMGEALQRDPSARFEYQRIMASDHPYDELVTWSKKSQAMQRIGGDPDAFIAAEIERRLSDPAELAKILERIRSATAAPIRPGQAPVTQLPPSLARLPAGGNAAEVDLSDAGIFAHATR